MTYNSFKYNLSFFLKWRFVLIMTYKKSLAVEKQFITNTRLKKIIYS